MKRLREWLPIFAGITGVLVLLAGSIWLWTSGPCGMYKYTKAGEVPARCVMHK